MIKGFITTCPNCQELTRIPTTKFESEPQPPYPWYERGKCEHCQTPIKMEIHNKSMKTEIDKEE